MARMGRRREPGPPRRRCGCGSEGNELQLVRAVLRLDEPVDQPHFVGVDALVGRPILQLVEQRARELLAGLVRQLVRHVKVIKSGELTRKVVLKGIGATAGAKAAIEAAGGSLA